VSFASKSALPLALLALTACYTTHGGDAGPIDARSIDARGTDAPLGPGLDAGDPDPRLDAPDPDPRVDAGTDAAFCLCASDLDCPAPPPSWNCLVPVCTSCECALRIEPERCGPGAVCDSLGECSAIPVDAAVVTIDAGPPPPRPDAFFIVPDAFVVPVDAFVPPVDAFVVPVDAWVRPGTDAGRPPSSDALRFTVDEVVTVPNRPGLSIGPELTFEMWARLRSRGVLAIKGDPSIGSHLYLEALPPDADGVFRTFWVGWSVGGTRVIVEASRAVPRDVWAHFALVQRETSSGRVEVELFIDGESATGAVDAGDVTTYIASFNAAPFVIGRTDMDVDEVRLWRVARGRAAIQSFMRTELMPGISGLIAYWPLDGVGQVVLDRSLNGNDGYRGNSPAADPADPDWILDGAF